MIENRSSAMFFERTVLTSTEPHTTLIADEHGTKRGSCRGGHIRQIWHVGLLIDRHNHCCRHLLLLQVNEKKKEKKIKQGVAEGV